jgi:hypothetical protein
MVIVLAGKHYELLPHADGRPGYTCWSTKDWAWPGIPR